MSRLSHPQNRREMWARLRRNKPVRKSALVSKSQMERLKSGEPGLRGNLLSKGFIEAHHKGERFILGVEL